MQLKDRLIDFIGRVIRNGGTIATYEHTEERRKTCLGCEFLGEVQILPTIKVKEGCTKCSCPISTKTKCIENIDPKTGKMKLTQCGNAEKGGADYWEEIEKKYQKEYGNIFEKYRKAKS